MVRDVAAWRAVSHHPRARPDRSGFIHSRPSFTGLIPRWEVCTNVDSSAVNPMRAEFVDDALDCDTRMKIRSSYRRRPMPQEAGSGSPTSCQSSSFLVAGAAPHACKPRVECLPTGRRSLRSLLVAGARRRLLLLLHRIQDPLPRDHSTMGAVGRHRRHRPRADDDDGEHRRGHGPSGRSTVRASSPLRASDQGRADHRASRGVTRYLTDSLDVTSTFGLQACRRSDSGCTSVSRPRVR